MKNNFSLYFNVFSDLLRLDWMILKKNLGGKFINRLIWVSTYVIIMSYIMPSFGLTVSYGPFILAGLIGSIGLLEVYSNAAWLIADLEGERTISYFLTLPIPPRWIFIRLICHYTLEYALLALIILPFGNMMLQQPMDLALVSWWRFALIFILINFFHGTGVIWLASRTKSMATLSNGWSRIIHPIWFFGGFQFSWLVLYNVWPKLAYLMLLNPVIYTMEGLRAALLGQEGYLPFWMSSCAIVFFTLLLGWHGINQMKKRLDFV